MVIKKNWEFGFTGSPSFILAQNLKLVSKALGIWNKESFGHIQSSINLINSQLAKIQLEDPSNSTLSIEENLKLSLYEQLKREETLWRQKSRLQWLTTTYLNIKFFHMTFTMRRKNDISFIKDSSNQWISNTTSIKNLFLDHFNQIYISSSPTLPEDLENLFP